MNAFVPESFRTQHQWNRALSHELIHAYDDCRADLRRDDVRHIACTEIRAANLSGDCDFWDELSRNPLSFEISGLQQKCVRKRTLQSMRNNKIRGVDLEAVVDEVFPACYRDTAPFASN